MIRLVKPTIKYKQSFINGIKEFQREEKTSKENIKKLEQDFSGFVKQMRNYEKGKNLPKRRVASTYLWLTDGKQWIGETNIRHKLNRALKKDGGHIGYGIRPSKRKKGYGVIILALALRKAQRLGIKKALVTCDDDNIGSRKIIESNGGILQNKIKYKGKVIYRYWIKIF